MATSMNRDGRYELSTLGPNELGVYAAALSLPGSFSARASIAAAAPGEKLLMAGECFADPHGEWLGDPAQLLTRYARSGDATRFVARLNGSFSGLLIDAQRGQAALFNDRYGSERLYIHRDGKDLYFASEAKALLAVLPELRHFDPAGLADFLQYGSVQQGRSLFRGITQMPGGSLWSFRPQGVCEAQRYFEPAEWEAQAPMSAAAYEDAFAQAFTQRLPSYFGAGDRIGISLTGGLDTRMIMAAMAGAGSETLCYTYGALQGDTRDVQLARRIARQLGLPHHTVRIQPEFLGNYAEHLDDTVWATDGCAGAQGAHEVHLSAQAATLAPIRMTGNFGSEILRAMSTLKPQGLAAGYLRPGLLDTLQAASAREEPQAQARPQHPVTAAAFAEIPWHLFGTMAAARSLLTFRSPYLDNDLVQLAYRAPPEIRRSARPAMALVQQLNAGLASIPTDRAALLHSGPLQPLKRAWAEITFKLDYYHFEGLPRKLAPLEPLLRTLQPTGLLGQHKFLPYRGWFRHELGEYMSRVLTDPRTLDSNLWDPVALKRIAHEHLGGQQNHTREIHTILTLESVHRQFQLAPLA